MTTTGCGVGAQDGSYFCIDSLRRDLMPTRLFNLFFFHEIFREIASDSRQRPDDDCRSEVFQAAG